MATDPYNQQIAALTGTQGQSQLNMANQNVDLFSNQNLQFGAISGQSTNPVATSSSQATANNWANQVYQGGGNTGQNQTALLNASLGAQGAQANAQLSEQSQRFQGLTQQQASQFAKQLADAQNQYQTSLSNTTNTLSNQLQLQGATFGSQVSELQNQLNPNFSSGVVNQINTSYQKQLTDLQTQNQTYQQQLSALNSQLATLGSKLTVPTGTPTAQAPTGTPVTPTATTPTQTAPTGTPTAQAPTGTPVTPTATTPTSYTLPGNNTSYKITYGSTGQPMFQSPAGFTQALNKGYSYIYTNNYPYPFATPTSSLSNYSKLPGYKLIGQY